MCHLVSLRCGVLASDCHCASCFHGFGCVVLGHVCFIADSFVHSFLALLQLDLNVVQELKLFSGSCLSSQSLVSQFSLTSLTVSHMAPWISRDRGSWHKLEVGLQVWQEKKKRKLERLRRRQAIWFAECSERWDFYIGGTHTCE